MSTCITSGPLFNDLLFLSQNHRAAYVFYQPQNLRDGGLLRIRSGDEKLWSYLREVEISDNVMHYIEMMGFSGIIQCYNRRVDNALISALVERWRPETHTFHMPFGEVTVTLEDVAVLYGFRVDGPVVSGNDYKLTNQQIIENFYNLTGITITATEIRSQQINLPFIVQTMLANNLDNPSDLQCIQRARTIIFCIIGGLFSTSASNWVNVKYLNHIEDLNACGQLSWASAVLAVLYRILCNATDPEAVEIGSPVLLLQLWAWERFPLIAPEAVSFHDLTPNKPYGSRWGGPLSFRETPSHVLSMYRSTFNLLNDSQFYWRPYDQVLYRVPEAYKNGQESWRCDTFLICWHMVEPHIPSRVLRQLGMFQPIPTNTMITADVHRELHGIKRAGRQHRDWVQIYAPYITLWHSRVDSIVNENMCESIIASQEYMTWFRSHTVLYTTDPTRVDPNPRHYPNVGGMHTMFVDGFSQVRQITGEPQSNEVAGRFAEYANAQHHISYQPTLETTNVAPQLPPVTQRVRRRNAPVNPSANVEEFNQGEEMFSPLLSNYDFPHNSPEGNIIGGESSQIIIPTDDNMFSSILGFDNIGTSSSNFITPATQIPVFNPQDLPDQTQRSQAFNPQDFSRRDINIDLNLAADTVNEDTVNEDQGESSLPLARRRGVRKNAGIPKPCFTQQKRGHDHR